MDDLPDRVGLPHLLGVSLDAATFLIGVLVNINNFHVIVLVSHFEKAVTAPRPFLPEFPDVIHDHFIGNFPVVGVLIIAIGSKMPGKHGGSSMLACL